MRAQEIVLENRNTVMLAVLAAHQSLVPEQKCKGAAVSDHQGLDPARLVSQTNKRDSIVCFLLFKKCRDTYIDAQIDTHAPTKVASTARVARRL